MFSTRWRGSCCKRCRVAPGKLSSSSAFSNRSACTIPPWATTARARTASRRMRALQAIRGMGPLSVLTSGHLSGPVAPAGAIYASADDMARWLRAQLAHGDLGNGKRLFSDAQSKVLWTPVTIVPITPAPAPIAAITPNFSEYALGFFVQDYRGHKIITHSGAVLGGLSAVAIVP